MAGRRSVPLVLKHILIALLVVVVVTGAAGFVMFRIQTPVSLESAVDRFRAGNDDVTSGKYQVEHNHRRVKSVANEKKGREASAAAASSERFQATPSKPPTTATPPTARVSSPLFDVMPAEGVYRYVGSGREGIWPYERPFDTSTHRIITHEDRDTWVEHHIFSEERASWTRVSISEEHRLVHHQRNYVKIGTYEEDKVFPFYPPIVAARFPPRVGKTWGATSRGETNDGESYTGTWTVEMVGGQQRNIGGTRVKVTAYEFDILLEGEFNGTVSVNAWYAPRYGLTVREEYYADANIGPLEYFGEWFVELRSLEPHT